MFLSQVFDGLLLPIILVFVMLLARDAKLMGELRSGVALGTIGWVITAVLALLSIAVAASQILGL